MIDHRAGLINVAIEDPVPRRFEPPALAPSMLWRRTGVAPCTGGSLRLSWDDC